MASVRHARKQRRHSPCHVGTWFADIPSESGGGTTQRETAEEAEDKDPGVIKSAHPQRGSMSADQRDRQHQDMVYHIAKLQRRNDLLQAALDDSQAKMAKLMRETFK